MYDALTDSMTTFTADYPALWALLVMAVVACTSLLLYAFWEVVLRLLFLKGSVKNNGKRSLG